VDPAAVGEAVGEARCVPDEGGGDMASRRMRKRSGRTA
jgi:hypothetical protein